MTKQSSETPLEAKAREIVRRRDDLGLNARHFVKALTEDESIKMVGRTAVASVASLAVGLLIGAVTGRRPR